MGLYEVPLSMSLLDFGILVSQLPYVWYYVGVKSSFQHARASRGHMWIRCLMFSLSGPCELLFLLCFIAPWTRVVVSVMLYPCILWVALLIDLFVVCVACFTVFGCGFYFVVECYGSV